MLINAPVLALYDPKKELRLENVASEYGLGSALFQEGKPVVYASRTDTEKRYAQIEKEMLALSFGLEKFHHYTYGRHVSVVTDHKLLVAIVTKPLSKAPKRLQALLLRKQEYNYMLTYKSGKSIPVADDLSHHLYQTHRARNRCLLTISRFYPSKVIDLMRSASQLNEMKVCLA